MTQRRICPVCRAVYAGDVEVCPVDAAALLDMGDNSVWCGQTLDDRYLVLEKIGQGGMGEVLSAWQISMERMVAIKVVAKAAASRPDAVERFRREAKLLASLTSPHTVATYDFGTLEDGSLFLVMEYLRGSSLQDTIEQVGPVEPSLVCELLQQVCLSIEEAHGKGIVHRDLKPSNVMVMTVGVERVFAKVLDFGIAKVLQDDNLFLTQQGTTVGTPIYMSPEQARNRGVGPATDIYAIGLLAFEMLTGRPAFTGDTAMQVVTRHLEEPAPHLPDVLLQTDLLCVELDRVIQTCLAKRPEARFPDVASLRIVLEGLVVTRSRLVGTGRSSGGLLSSRPTLVAEGVQTPPMLPSERIAVEPAPAVRALHDAYSQTESMLAVPANEIQGPTCGTEDGFDADARYRAETAETGALVLTSETGLTVPKGEPAEVLHHLAGSRGKQARLLPAIAGVLVVAVLAAVVWGVLPLLEPASSKAPGAQVADTTQDAVRDPAQGVTGEAAGTIRLLVLPFASAGPASRDADRMLWPLVDRIIYNSLYIDEYLCGRIERVDPFQVVDLIKNRQMDQPLSRDAALELAVATGATWVLSGMVGREAGMVVVSGVLLEVASGRESEISSSGGDVVASGQGLAKELRRSWAWSDPGECGGGESALVWLAGESGARLMAGIGPWVPRWRRAELLETAAGVDSRDAGPAWLAFVDDYRSSALATRLGEAASVQQDSNLGRFFSEMSNLAIRPDACSGVDVQALNEKYPVVIGYLGSALCQQRAGNNDEAFRLALKAFDNPATRPNAARLVARLLPERLSCQEALPVRTRLQQAFPENAIGWSALGYYLADSCGHLDEAEANIRVARSLLVEDRRARYLVLSNSLMVALVRADMEQAAELLVQLEAAYEVAWMDQKYYFVRALALRMQGRYQAAADVLMKGVDLFGRKAGDSHTVLAISYFWDCIERGDRNEARRVANDFERLYRDSSDVGNQYWARCLAAIAELVSGEATFEVTAARLGVFGDELVKVGGEFGLFERETQDCLFVSHFGNREQAKAILLSASPGNRNLGGCRYRYAELLFEQGRPAEAVDQFGQAWTAIIMSWSFYGGFLPGVLAGRGEALEASGQPDAAYAAYDKLTMLYGNADRELSEVEKARAGKVRVGPSVRK